MKTNAQSLMGFTLVAVALVIAGIFSWTNAGYRILDERTEVSETRTVTTLVKESHVPLWIWLVCWSAAGSGVFLLTRGLIMRTTPGAGAQTKRAA